LLLDLVRFPRTKTATRGAPKTLRGRMRVAETLLARFIHADQRSASQNNSQGAQNRLKVSEKLHVTPREIDQSSLPRRRQSKESMATPKLKNPTTLSLQNLSQKRPTHLLGAVLGVDADRDAGSGSGCCRFR